MMKDDSKKKGISDDNTTATDSSASVDSQNQVLHEVMADNLELMLEIILKVREDEAFARSVYADCPRLQHLLDQNPDLRPIFEDPNLVRINFEQVYRKAGGVLPEDKPPLYKRVLVCIVKHPLFKVFRLLLLVKKMYTCILGGGLGMIKNMFASMFCNGGVEALGDNLDAEDMLDANVNPESLASKEALNKVADHMQEPEVQEQMNMLLDSNPEQLDEAIEQDPELRALRENNPLCAELMNDPTTMKILVDPDNLRALAECPDLIEADFSNPDWSPPDIERVPFDDLAPAEEADQLVDAENNPEQGVETAEEEIGEDGAEEGEGDEEEEEEGFMDEFERGDEAEQGKPANKKQEKKKDNKQKEGQGGFLSTIGTGLMDYIAAETVGVTASEMMGGGDDFDVVDDIEDQALEEAIDEAAEMADDGVDAVEEGAEDAVETAQNLATHAATAAEMAAEAAEEDLVGTMEDTMDTAEEGVDKTAEEKANEAVAAAGNAASTGALVMGGIPGKSADGTTRSALLEEDEDSGENDDDDKPKKGRFKRFGTKLGGGFGALTSAAKEFAIGAVLGEDLAEELVEKMEESDDEDDEKKNTGSSSRLDASSSSRLNASSSSWFGASSNNSSSFNAPTD